MEEKKYTSASIRGRHEALQIILALAAESGLDDYITSFPEGDSGDYSNSWDEKKLKELFHVGEEYENSPGARIARAADDMYWEIASQMDDFRTVKELAKRLIGQVENGKVDKGQFGALELLRGWVS